MPVKMRIQSQSLMFTPLFLLLSLLLFDTAFARAREHVDPNDPHVVEIGRYAVDTYNKQERTNLNFLNVDEGESQTLIPNGKIYNLTVNVVDRGLIRTYVAVVYEPPSPGLKELRSFDDLRKYGGFNPVDPRDPLVDRTGNIAVYLYNKQAVTSLVFKKVIAAQAQITKDSTNYKLTITVADGGIYDAPVSVALDGQVTVKRFTPVACIRGGFCSRDPDDPHVIEIGRYSVNEFNKRAHISLQFKNVIKAKTQEVAVIKTVIEAETQVAVGINYRLIITAAYLNDVQYYQAVVYESAREGFRSLTSFKSLA